MRDEYKSLLQRITARHNAEIQQRHDNGKLDFVPTDRTTETMLETIIALYARDDDENGSHGMPASPLYTPHELFCTSYAPYYYEAIKLRYPEYTGI